MTQKQYDAIQVAIRRNYSKDTADELMELIDKPELMKEITIDGRTFKYEIKVWESLALVETYFYEGTEEMKYRKYKYFGKIITKIIPKLIFTIPTSANNPKYTKDQWKLWIKAELKSLEREEELKKGELI